MRPIYKSKAIPGNKGTYIHPYSYSIVVVHKGEQKRWTQQKIGNYDFQSIEYRHKTIYKLSMAGS